MFRSPDLEKWTVSLGNKQTLLLVNKADLLSEKQRKMWADYFTKENIPFVFFSARVESEKNQQRMDEEESEGEDNLEDPDDDEDDEEAKDQDEMRVEMESTENRENPDPIQEENSEDKDNGKKRKREDTTQLLTASTALSSHRLVGAQDLLQLITEKCAEIVKAGMNLLLFT